MIFLLDILLIFLLLIKCIRISLLEKKPIFCISSMKVLKSISDILYLQSNSILINILSYNSNSSSSRQFSSPSILLTKFYLKLKRLRFIQSKRF